MAPETITYIEAHGTGTPLGDPIEIAGLKRAFSSTSKKLYCGIGTVKTNIGHLEAASGIAGVIKTILAMKYGELPRLQNFSRQNERVDLSDSPFYLVTENCVWARLKDEKGQVVPRRAGVSSFGFGGTNAHVIVEEGPEQMLSTQQTKPYYLITLSAKHPDSLAQKVEDLKTFLDSRLRGNDGGWGWDGVGGLIEAISYTLNTGRSHFNYRLSIVVSSLEELKTKLNNTDTDNWFKGDASQKPEDAAIYKKVLETIVEELKAQSSVDLQKYNNNLEALANLYVKGYELDWELVHQGEAHQKISLPTYPFLKNRYWFDSFVPEQPFSDALAPELPSLHLRSGSMMNSMDFNPSDYVEIQVDEQGIAVVKMIDERHRNQLSHEMIQSLEKTFTELSQKNDIKVVVLTGVHDIFCMGGDKNSLMAVTQQAVKFSDMPFVYEGLLRCPVPVITVMHGHAFGGGFSFGLYGDFVLLAAESLYAANFMKYGFTPGVGATLILKEKLSAKVAHEMIWTGEEYSGQQLREAGVVVDVYPKEQLWNEAMRLARSLAKKSRTALEILKQQEAEKILRQLPEAIADEQKMHATIFANPEASQNVQAYFEKLEGFQVKRQEESLWDSLSL